jgi:hypothetical protein
MLSFPVRGRRFVIKRIFESQSFIENWKMNQSYVKTVLTIPNAIIVPGYFLGLCQASTRRQAGKKVICRHGFQSGATVQIKKPTRFIELIQFS